MNELPKPDNAVPHTNTFEENGVGVSTVLHWKNWYQGISFHIIPQPAVTFPYRWVVSIRLFNWRKSWYLGHRNPDAYGVR